MTTRRRFLGLLSALPAVTALAGAGIRLAPRRDIEMVGDFSTANMRYRCYERFSNIGPMTLAQPNEELNKLLRQVIEDADRVSSIPPHPIIGTALSWPVR